MLFRSEIEVGKADKSGKQISADAQGEGESPPRKSPAANPNKASESSPTEKESSQRTTPEGPNSETGSSNDLSDSESNAVTNGISNSKPNPDSDSDLSSDSATDSDSTSDGSEDDKTSGSPSSLRNRPRPKHHIPGLRPLGRGANIDGTENVPVTTTASAPLGKVKPPLKSLSQATDTENIPPRSESKSGSAGVKKPEIRTTLKSLKQQKNGEGEKKDAGRYTGGRKLGYAFPFLPRF